MENQKNNKNKYTIELLRSGCIECGACAKMAPKLWELDKKDFKANLIGAKNRIVTKDGVIIKESLETDDIKGYDGYFQTSKCCPVRVIQIVDNKSKKRLEVVNQKLHEVE